MRVPFYFVADRCRITLAAARDMPFVEFYSWLNYHGFWKAIEKQ